MLLKDFRKTEDLQKLADSDFNFYITGSQYFETNNENSDIDLFVKDSKQVCKLLDEKGFKRISRSTYDTIQGITGIMKKDNIHVQIVKDAEQKANIQGELKRKGIFKNKLLTKEQKQLIWDTAYRLLI